MDAPTRLVVSTCVGCGSMREFPTCEGTCRERKLELVSAGDHEALQTAALASRSRLEPLLALVGELAAPARPGAGSTGTYEALRDRARGLARAHRPAAPDDDAAMAPVEPIVVWRCPDCGGFDETQPCIGVCLWRPAEWVALKLFESERAKALRDLDWERTLAALVTRFARVRPRDGESELNRRAFRTQARHALAAGVRGPAARGVAR